MMLTSILLAASMCGQFGGSGNQVSPSISQQMVDQYGNVITYTLFHPKDSNGNPIHYFYAPGLKGQPTGGMRMSTDTDYSSLLRFAGMVDTRGNVRRWCYQTGNEMATKGGMLIASR